MKAFWFFYAFWLAVMFIGVVAFAAIDPVAAGMMAMACSVVSATLASGYVRIEHHNEQ